MGNAMSDVCSECHQWRNCHPNCGKIHCYFIKSGNTFGHKYVEKRLAEGWINILKLLERLKVSNTSDELIRELSDYADANP